MWIQIELQQGQWFALITYNTTQQRATVYLRFVARVNEGRNVTKRERVHRSLGGAQRELAEQPRVLCVGEILRGVAMTRKSKQNAFIRRKR